MLAIEVQGLTKTYSGMFRRAGQPALRGVALSVPTGEAFGLIGPNGAGKTTFIKAILGVLRPTSGQVRIFGADPQEPAVRRRLGYLPERLYLPPSWRPLEFLQSVSRLKRCGARSSELATLLSRVGLADAAGRRMGGFSKGMRQRVGLAAALVGRPDLLVLDEPTDGVDPVGRVEIRRLLSEEVSRGATLFLNSHLLAETEKLCVRIGILSQGKLVRVGPLDELRRAKSRWHVRFEGGDPARLAEAGFTATPTSGLYACDAEDPASLNQALDRARAYGALVVELGRESKDLEGVLAEALEAA